MANNTFSIPQLDGERVHIIENLSLEDPWDINVLLGRVPTARAADSAATATTDPLPNGLLETSLELQHPQNPQPQTQLQPQQQQKPPATLAQLRKISKSVTARTPTMPPAMKPIRKLSLKKVPNKSGSRSQAGSSKNEASSSGGKSMNQLYKLAQETNNSIVITDSEMEEDSMPDSMARFLEESRARLERFEASNETLMQRLQQELERMNRALEKLQREKNAVEVRIQQGEVERQRIAQMRQMFV